MSTDDVSVSSRPCPCGKGDIEITTTSPDHPWARASQTSHSLDIKCPSCNAELAVNELSLVDRKSFETYRALKAQQDELWKAIRQHPFIAEVRLKIAEHLDSKPSIAERYRTLSKANIGYGSEGSFRRQWSGGHNWAQLHINGYNIKNAASLVDLEQTPVDDLLKQIAALEAAEPKLKPVWTYKYDF